LARFHEPGRTDVRENRLRALWRDNKTALNGWLLMPDGIAAETLAHAGFDALTIDLQHGLIDYQAMLPMLQAISTTPTVPIVRVPWLEPGILMKSLDAGAYGVICPMVNTREEAQKFVAWTHYAPKGARSFGPIRASLYGGADYATHANDTIVAFAMVETQQALDNLDSILSVEGLDAIYVGPADLALTLGCTPHMSEPAPKVAEAIAHVLVRCKAHGVRAGIHCPEAEAARRRVAQGFDLVTIGHDQAWLAAGAQQTVARVRA
jgi:4-hydroxy-2-oxoheptanedioate aldolase